VVAVFQQEYLLAKPWALSDFDLRHESQHQCSLRAQIHHGHQQITIEGEGGGPVDAFIQGLRQALGIDARLSTHHEHSLGEGEDAEAAAYVSLHLEGQTLRFGVGRDQDIVAASLKAVLAAINGFQSLPNEPDFSPGPTFAE